MQDAGPQSIGSVMVPPLTAPIARRPLGSPRTPPTPLTVYLAGKIAATGDDAGTVRLHTLAKALPSAGIAVHRWERGYAPLAKAHCLHLFGDHHEHLAALGEARRHDVKVVLSPLAWTAPSAGPRWPAVTRALVECFRWLGRRACPRALSWRGRLLESVDLVVATSNIEAQHLLRRQQVPAERVRVVPQGADVTLAKADPEPFADLVGLRDFVLVAGPIAPGENQLSLLWALRELAVPAVVLGDAAPGCEWYLAQCRGVAGPRVRFVPQLEHDDPLMASAYAACGCLVRIPSSPALPSGALEAGMSGTPLVLSGGGCADEYFGHQALYVRPDDVAGVRRAVQTALARGRSKDLAQHVRTYFSLAAMSRAMRQAYAQLLGRRERR
jgi:glycosyltransferase involved in cell wall biosynthesis